MSATVVSNGLHRIQTSELLVEVPVTPKRPARAHGDGSIQQVAGRTGYRAQIRLPDGRRPTKQCRTKKEAAEWIAEQRLSVSSGRSSSGKSPRLGEWLDLWFSRRTASSQTLYNERTLRKNYFAPLEKIPLEKLTTGTIKRWLAEIDQRARKKKPGVGQPHVLRLCYALLSSSLSGAIDDGVISTNPMIGVKRPLTPKAQPKYLDEETLRRFLEIDFGPRDDPRRVAVMLMLWLGLRRGEALGLTWEDVDLVTGEIRIRQQLARLRTEGAAKSVLSRVDLKTDSSLRDLIAAPALLATLRERHGTLAQPPRLDDYVVSYRHGRPIDPDAFSLWLRKISAEHGIRVSPHRLRHTAATVMLNRVGPLEQVASFLGHADIRTTSVYARITPSTRGQATLALGAILDSELPDCSSSM